MQRIIVALFFFPLLTIAQSGGNTAYSFMEMPVQARVASLGGNLISVKDDDATLGIDNPSLLNANMHNALNLTYVNYISDINYGMFSYVRDYSKWGTFSSGIRYLNYGKFTETDENANIIGTFKAAEYLFHTGWGKEIDSLFSIGANFKTIYSSLQAYRSLAFAFDFAGTYFNAKRGVTASALIKNAGISVKSYIPNHREKLPFELQAGISKKWENMPFRFSFIFHNLQQFNLSYPDSSANSLTSLQEEKKIKKFSNNLLRHLIVGMEFMPSKNFALRFGFNYNRRKELKLATRPGIVGFTAGLGFKVNRFHLSYALAAQHLGAFSNHITISTKISDFYSPIKPEVTPAE